MTGFIWDMWLDVVNLINALICIGYSVDFVTHFTHAYLESKGTSREEKVTDALCDLGTAVLQAGGATIIISWPLGIARNIAMQSIFRALFLCVLLSVFHCLVILPVLLSYFGPLGSHAIEEDIFSVREKKELEPKDDIEEALDLSKWTIKGAKTKEIPDVELFIKGVKEKNAYYKKSHDIEKSGGGGGTLEKCEGCRLRYQEDLRQRDREKRRERAELEDRGFGPFGYEMSPLDSASQQEVRPVTSQPQVSSCPNCAELPRDSHAYLVRGSTLNRPNQDGPSAIAAHAEPNISQYLPDENVPKVYGDEVDKLRGNYQNTRKFEAKERDKETRDSPREMRRLRREDVRHSNPESRRKHQRAEREIAATLQSKKRRAPNLRRADTGAEIPTMRHSRRADTGAEIHTMGHSRQTEGAITPGVPRRPAVAHPAVEHPAVQRVLRGVDSARELRGVDSARELRQGSRDSSGQKSRRQPAATVIRPDDRYGARLDTM